MENGTIIKSMWMRIGHYVQTSYVMEGAEESWVNALRGNAKEVKVIENGKRFIANDHGNGFIDVWTGNKFEVVRVD